MVLTIYILYTLERVYGVVILFPEDSGFLLLFGARPKSKAIQFMKSIANANAFDSTHRCAACNAPPLDSSSPMVLCFYRIFVRDFDESIADSIKQYV